ncbi:MAG: hypothetical protein ACPGWR_28400 [Ardenticatenaceae bacterium]
MIEISASEARRPSFRLQSPQPKALLPAPLHPHTHPTCPLFPHPEPALSAPNTSKPAKLRDDSAGLADLGHNI